MKQDIRCLDSTLFLDMINEKLKERLQKLKAELDRGYKEIRGMNEYYWENYAEMDQYGYEEYDNQQALLHQIHVNEDREKLISRYVKMSDNPFFGRVDFRFQGEEEAESFYIGIANFAEQSGMTPLIYDWRAPISGLFYDFDKGPAAYEAPMGVMQGHIESKRQYHIRRGKMIYSFESDVKIDDEILKRELGSSSDVRLKNIVCTIQKEQNEIIRNRRDRILAIQGAAGSGKTSIALHRIAYLLYHDRKNLTSSNVLILSPNSVFADYISHILPELGEENIREMSFDLFAYKELQDVVSDCEDRYDHLERMMKFPHRLSEERFRQKQSAFFIGQVETFLALEEDDLMRFKDVDFRGMKVSESEIIRLFYEKFYDTPILTRMDAVMDYYVDSYETLRGRNMDEEEKELLRRKFDSMYETKDIYVIYRRLMKMCGWEPLSLLPHEKRKLAYEDVFPMLYLKYRLTGKSPHNNIKHLVIDEMQDYSYLQYVILRELFNCRMTILGDFAQTLDTKKCDVLSFLPEIFGKDIRMVTMNKSYRNTWEIATYAARISGLTGIELLERHGKEVEERRFETEEEMLEEIMKRACTARDTKKESFETSAVITMTCEQAFDIYRLLKDKGADVSYVDRNSSYFRKGMTVTTFYLAKGLEFDQVFSIRTRGHNPMTDQAAYICATRALHELYIYDTEG